jgi:hypothetical protein
MKYKNLITKIKRKNQKNLILKFILPVTMFLKRLKLYLYPYLNMFYTFRMIADFWMLMFP